jgi:hypothetical protein
MSTHDSTPTPEVFKPIPDYPGYRVSDRGRVQSCWGRGRPIRIHGQGCEPGDRPYKDLALCSIKQNRAGGRRLVVDLSRGGKSTKHHVSRLVLRAFVGPCPEGMEACHNDGNPYNNTLGNLRWDTHRSNIDDIEIHGTRERGSSHHMAKLTEEDVALIRKHLREKTHLQKELCALFNVSPAGITQIKQGKTWKHVV